MSTNPSNEKIKKYSFMAIFTVITTIIALYIANKDSSISSIENDRVSMEKLCEEFVTYGRTGTIKDYLNIFCSRIDYYNEKGISKSDIKDYLIPKKKEKDLSISILNNEIAINLDKSSAIFTILLEEYCDGQKVFKHLQNTEIVFNKQNDTYKICEIIITSENTALDKRQKCGFDKSENIKLNGIKGFVNLSRVFLRESYSLTSPVVTDDSGKPIKLEKNQDLEIMGSLESSKYNEGYRKGRHYGVIILSESIGKSKVEIVTNNKIEIIDNDAIIPIKKWLKVKIQNRTGFVVSDFVNIKQ